MLTGIPAVSAAPGRKLILLEPYPRQIIPPPTLLSTVLFKCIRGIRAAPCLWCDLMSPARPHVSGLAAPHFEYQSSPSCTPHHFDAHIPECRARRLITSDAPFCVHIIKECVHARARPHTRAFTRPNRGTSFIQFQFCMIKYAIILQILPFNSV